MNRRLLRSLMLEGGFRVISTEWWHFDGLPGAVVRQKYKLIQ
jgi:D-alanyl-D-alanine dipeptidase